MNFSFYTI